MAPVLDQDFAVDDRCLDAEGGLDQALLAGREVGDAGRHAGADRRRGEDDQVGGDAGPAPPAARSAARWDPSRNTALTASGGRARTAAQVGKRRKKSCAIFSVNELPIGSALPVPWTRWPSRSSSSANAIASSETSFSWRCM